MTFAQFVEVLLRTADKYFFIAAPVFLIFYILIRKKIAHKKIQLKFPKNKDYYREIFFSTLSIVIFAIPPLVILYTPAIRVHTRFYTDIDQHGIIYFILAFPIMLLLHDTYFYWAHRWMHSPALFKTVHLVHHRSTNPSPWAAYAFHPLEAVVESFIFVIFLFTLPIHPAHLKFFFTFSLLYNVYGHLGFELYPKGFNRNWFGRWINTSTSHNQHHQYFKGNYGLYFTMWDRWMGTLRPDYDDAFSKTRGRQKPAALADK